MTFKKLNNNFKTNVDQYVKRHCLRKNKLKQLERHVKFLRKYFLFSVLVLTMKISSDFIKISFDFIQEKEKSINLSKQTENKVQLV